MCCCADVESGCRLVSGRSMISGGAGLKGEEFVDMGSSSDVVGLASGGSYGSDSPSGISETIFSVVAVVTTSAVSQSMEI